MDNHFKIIVPFYNVEQWIKLTTRSIRAQDYKNFECILIDDMSTDNSIDIVKEEVGDDKRFRIVENKNKKYVLKNISDAISLSKPNNEDIIVILDGDDWFAKKDVLTLLNETYNKEGCWLTYGSYMEYPSKARGKFAKQVPKEIIDGNLFRASPWMTSHLRTWKYGLWKHIDQQKAFVESSPRDDNNHFAFCWDLAYMFPLLELAGCRAHYISDILYVYNRQNPLCCDKIKHQIQLEMEHKIRNMQRYTPLEKL
jgi:glycosyltransferase involved in cell wall biosynthesis